MPTLLHPSRADALTAAESAIGDADWQGLADWLCRLMRDHWPRPAGEALAAQTAEGRASPPVDATSPRVRRDGREATSAGR